MIRFKKILIIKIIINFNQKKLHPYHKELYINRTERLVKNLHGCKDQLLINKIN